MKYNADNKRPFHVLQNIIDELSAFESRDVPIENHYFRIISI
jgi:hypothetical protein